MAASRVRYGYRRLHVLLLREGYRLNHKRTYRLYREEGLSIRTKTPKRKRAWRYRSDRPKIAAVNHCWAMDFMSDALFNGRPFRLLTVAPTEGMRRGHQGAVRAAFHCKRAPVEVASPHSFRRCYGPEFAGKMLDQWAECLNASWFLSMADAIERIEEWRCHYNNDRPHTSPAT